MGAIPVIEIQNRNTVAITNIKVPEANAGDSRQRVRRFTFDCCFQENATQDDIFSKVEEVVSKAIKRRYHSCVLAYGQSSTGKTHTMMGFPHDPGLTPRLSQKIFEYLQETAVGNELENMKTTVSYLEIYNEKVRDLLVSENSQNKNFRTLRVREHPKKGPYVQGLTEHQVRNSQDLLNWVRVGNQNRRVASTFSNPHSSRSHSVVTITYDGVRLYLVDLAGSERAGTKLYTTSRFREGANINRSLVALGNVISALAEQPSRAKTGRRRFVPYRDSVLTWLLKDTLGGNSNTVMIATISPSSGCYSETVNTLRFGQRAKLIVSCPVVNEDPKEKIIRELRTEVEKLRELLKGAQIHPLGYMHENSIFCPQETPDIPSSISLNNPTSKCSQTFDLEAICPIENNLENDQEFCEQPYKIAVESKVTHISTEKLIPVMNVEANVNVSADKKKIPKFRRTASVDLLGSMDKSRTSSFGSHESLPTTKPPTAGSKIPPKTSSPAKPLAASRTLSTSNPLMRRRSVDNKSSLKSLFQRKSIPEIPKKAEKSVETETTKNEIKSRVDSHRKTVQKPRSDIVANVTRRLYLKSKNKDAGTDMEGFDEPKNEVPKELSICSNARLRLKEITQKALRAHRFKQVETQTDRVVLRVKEIATDVQDLRLHIPELRDVGTGSPQCETVDASVGCSLLDNFNNSDSNNFMKVSKTCAVQCSEDLLPIIDDENVPPIRETSPSRVSFTKYLQEHKVPVQPSIECINPSIANPIYANSVNINVSHHYLNGKRVGSLSDDSLEERSSNNVLFPTPDLISNHNSLDPNIHAMQNEQSRSSRELISQYAEENIGRELLISIDEFTCEKPEEKKAKIYSIADIKENISFVSLPLCAYLPEVCVTEKFQNCSPLQIPQFDSAKAIVTECKDPICYETITIYEPTILKSCVKILPNITDVRINEPVDEITTSSAPEADEFRVPDSLEYHKVNRVKHVRFSPEKKNNEDNMFKAMSSFLEEATIMMNNITKATKNLETSSNSSTIQEFDLQITLDDISSLENFIRAKKRKSKHENRSSFQVQTQTDSIPCNQSSSQTCAPETFSHSTQYEDMSIPSNKFNSLLEESCQKLEYKLNSLNRKVPRRSDSNFVEVSPFPSLNSYVPSFSGISDTNEDLSVDSNPLSYSDYGSLNRRKTIRKRMPSCSPSAFLKQLTHMRRQVVESSREDLNDGNS